MFNLNGTFFYIHQSRYRLFQKFKRDTVMYICFDCSFGSTVQESNLGASIRSHKTFFVQIRKKTWPIFSVNFVFIIIIF